MEEEHSKNWILEQYLNTASYGTNNGRTAVGVEAASQVYFNKHVSDLDLAEAAMLAGLPQAPSEYNPFDSAAAARERRNSVLRKMYEQGYISLREEERALSTQLGLERGYRYETIQGDRYFFDFVEQDLIHRYGVNTVRQGGLEIYTTIEPDLQAAGQRAVDNRVSYAQPWSQALVSVDPDDGHIVAMASSGDYESDKYNLAAQGHRQPGSSFKPFVLATAISEGVDPDSTYYSGAAPATLSMGPYSEPWIVNNAGDTSGGGTMSLRAATVGSVNVVFAKLGLDVGPENFVDMAEDLGVEAPLDGYPAEAIGGLTVGVSPLDMATAYSTFASGGLHHPATAIDRVEFPNGDVDEPDEKPADRVLTEGEAYMVTDVLTGVVEAGTATAANYCGGGALAGKTGTTDDNTDAWFVGYSKNLATAVWTGDPDVNVSMGSSAFGGTYSAPTWNTYMSVADPACEPFDAPDELPRPHVVLRRARRVRAAEVRVPSTSTTPTTTTRPTTARTMATARARTTTSTSSTGPTPPTTSVAREPTRPRPGGVRADRDAARAARRSSLSALATRGRDRHGKRRRRRGHRPCRGDRDLGRPGGRGGPLPPLHRLARGDRAQGAGGGALRPGGDGRRAGRGLRPAWDPGRLRRRRVPRAGRRRCGPCREHGVAVLGGDVSAAPVLLVAISVVGHAPSADALVRRDGAERRRGALRHRRAWRGRRRPAAARAAGAARRVSSAVAEALVRASFAPRRDWPRGWPWPGPARGR